MTRWLAYAAYLVGSLLFLGAALHRGSPILALGSALFALGTLLHLQRELRARRARRERSDH